MRRWIDILFAIFWLVITAPLFLVIALQIKIDSSGPIFFVQRMVGYRGKEFNLLRFRTMYDHNTGIANRTGFTRVGKFIRNYSLDHLPLLVNLLRADITLVGPRPMEIDRVHLDEPVWQEYFQIKPGIFNYAVLKLGRLWTPTQDTHPTWNQELELAYRKRRSVTSDFQLFFQFMREYIASDGNVKARGKPEALDDNKRDR